jgi:hypothetical protein
MSQQMESDLGHSGESTPYATGYKDTPHYHDSFSSVGQKLTWRGEGDLPKDEFRLGLALSCLSYYQLLLLLSMPCSIADVKDVKEEEC